MTKISRSPITVNFEIILISKRAVFKENPIFLKTQDWLKQKIFCSLQRAISESISFNSLANALYLVSGIMKALGLENPSTGIARVNIKMFSDKLNIYMVSHKIPQCFALHKYHSSSLTTFTI